MTDRLAPYGGVRRLGPEIRFKDGCVLLAAHFRPQVARILYAAALEAPPLVDDVLVVTDAARLPSAGGKPSKHKPPSAPGEEGFSAIDIRTGVGAPPRDGQIEAPSDAERFEKAKDWAARIRFRLGSEYDVVFGDAAHRDHIHVEHDERPAFIGQRTVEKE